MESALKTTLVSQTSTNIKDVESKRAVPSTEWAEIHSTPSPSLHPTQPPADRRAVDDWIQDLPHQFFDVNEGTMRELTSVILLHFGAIERAVNEYQGPLELPEVFEQQQRFSALADGDSKLDQRLAEAPNVRALFVSNLTALVLVLNRGLNLFRPESQRGLFEKTNRVVEQASRIALLYLDRSVTYPPENILEFLNATKTEIKSRIDNLYDLLPIVGHLIKDFDETEPRQVEDNGYYEHKPFDLDMCIERLGIESGRLLSHTAPASESSSASHSAKDSRRHRSILSGSSKRPSYGPSNSSLIPSLTSDSGTRSNVYALTDTVTSDAPSEIEKCNTEPTTSVSTRGPSSCKQYGTTYSGLAGLRIMPFRRRKVLFPTTRKSHSKKLEPDRLVRIWPRQGHEYSTYHALIDTGADENLILRSAVQDLDLAIEQTESFTLQTVQDLSFVVSEHVQPKWQFQDDMILGNITRKGLGIHLRAPRNALIAYEDLKDRSTLDQQQQKRARQNRDLTAHQTAIRRGIEASRARLAQEKDKANGTKSVKPGHRTPQKDAAGSNNGLQ